MEDGDLRVTHKGKLDCGHLFKPTHALSGPPLNRKDNELQRQGKEKQHPPCGERLGHGLSLGLLPTMAWAAMLFVSGIKTPPRIPTPLTGNLVRCKQEWVARAVASVFGNLLMPGVPPL